MEVRSDPLYLTISTLAGILSRLLTPSFDYSHTSSKLCIWYVSGILDAICILYQPCDARGEQHNID